VREIIVCCAYCERTASEIVAPAGQDALAFVDVGGNRVLLCPEDRAERTPLTEAEQWELLNQPIDLPPGITALQHHCPMLEYDGFPAEEATSTLQLRHEGAYMVGNCPECGMQVRSPVAVPKGEPNEAS
jgi:hypothetical protein